MIDKIIWPVRGRYILAVSGGADSMALLDLFAAAAKDRAYELTVAHFDHGLRSDSGADSKFVEAAARRYGVPFASHQARLGRGSEATARAARHNWLEDIRRTYAAKAIVTGHHADDLLETSLLNLARGTGRRGLAPMQDGGIARPLIRLTRAELRDYAAAQGLTWHEDPTNTDPANPRNFLRHHLLPHASSAWLKRYTELIGNLSILNKQIDNGLAGLMPPLQPEIKSYSLPRTLVREFSLPELEECILAAARHLQPGIEPSGRTVHEMAVFAKTASPQRRRSLRQGVNVIIKPENVHIESSF